MMADASLVRWWCTGTASAIRLGREGELKAKEARLSLREAVLKAEGEDTATENGLGEGLKPQVVSEGTIVQFTFA
jgi:hypothetical protein